mmetsp:Transcript_6137/g.19743  ORF Transcript_6137/g.19743 Transcript_6137/m.19743 type:complete len:148 (+) Transcript_6137:163-606(+)
MSCNRGSSYCAFPRFHGEDIGDDTRNFIFYLGLVGLFNLMLSYVLWANQGSPRIFLLTPGLLSLGGIGYVGVSMKWLLCQPVDKPTNNFSNWISMPALETEHGRVALFCISALWLILLFDLCLSFVCCCCIEVVDETELSETKQKNE